MAEKTKKEITDKDVEEWFKKKFSEEWFKDGKCKTKDNHAAYKTGASTGAGVYCFGFIGSVVYFISTSTSFWDGVIGILKSFVWPAFLVYDLLKFLGS